MNRTDTELLDALQELNNRENYTGLCILRISTTGRGWRLHETSADGFISVREAINDYLDRESTDE